MKVILGGSWKISKHNLQQCLRLPSGTQDYMAGIAFITAWVYVGQEVKPLMLALIPKPEKACTWKFMAGMYNKLHRSDTSKGFIKTQ